MKEKKEQNTDKKNKGRLAILIPFAVLLLAVLVVSLVYDVLENGSLTAQEETTEDAKQAEDARTVELTLTYAYQNMQWNTAIERVIREFEEEHPEITITYEISYEDQVYEDILSKRIARNELGDIVQLKTPEPYAESGLLGEISDEVASQVSNLYSSGGKVYGVGAVESTWGVIYNKTLFENYGLAEPETYEDFLEICRKIKWNNVTPIGVGGGDLWHMEYWTNHFFRTEVLSADADWLKNCAAGQTAWTDAAPTEMMEHLSSLFSSGYVNEDWLTATDTSLPYRMSEGELAMIYAGPWVASAIEDLQPEMELGWFYVPDEDGVVYASDNLDTFWSVTASCAADEEKYEAAMTFLEFFYSDEVYAQVCADSGTFPLTDLAYQGEEGSVEADAYASLQAADVRASVYIGNEDTPQNFEKSMLETVRNVLNGDVGVTEGLQAIQDAWVQYSGGSL